MIRILFIFVFFLFNQAFAQDEVIQAGVKYNEASARIEVFKDVQKKIKKDFYAEYKKDKNRDKNLEAIKNKIYEVDNRILCPFYVKKTLISYAVVYSDLSEYCFYYNVLGSLIKFDIINSQEYPRKVLGYSRYGNLISATLEADTDEQFVYDEDGKLIAHWVNNELKNKNNKSPKVLKLRRGGN